MFILAFTLIEVFVLIGVCIVVAAVVVAIGVSLLRKGKEEVLTRIVKIGCAGDAKKGEENVALGDISQSALDVLTQGFSMDTAKAKIVWWKTGDRVCKYKIVVTGSDTSGNQGARETQEFEVKNCPT